MTRREFTAGLLGTTALTAVWPAVAVASEGQSLGVADLEAAKAMARRNAIEPLSLPSGDYFIAYPPSPVPVVLPSRLYDEANEVGALHEFANVQWIRRPDTLGEDVQSTTVYALEPARPTKLPNGDYFCVLTGAPTG